MAEAATKMPVRNEDEGSDRPVERPPFESLRREVDRLFEDFQLGPWHSPFGRGLFDVQPFWRGGIGRAPAVDIAETDKGYEITAELPGMDESNIGVKFADGTLTIKGEKRGEKEEKTRTGTFPSVDTARSKGRSGCRMASTPTRSKQISRTACSRSRCRKRRKHKGAKRRSRSERLEFGGSQSAQTRVQLAAVNLAAATLFGRPKGTWGDSAAPAVIDLAQQWGCETCPTRR
jgi:hypothetical protein